jgi:hypothetical protein
MRTKPFEASAEGTDEAREYLVRFMRETVGNATFAEYVRAELAGDFAWTLANHLAVASMIQEPNQTREFLAAQQRAVVQMQARHAGTFVKHFEAVPSTRLWNALIELNAGDWRGYAKAHIAHHWAKGELKSLCSLTLDMIDAELAKA